MQAVLGFEIGDRLAGLPVMVGTQRTLEQHALDLAPLVRHDDRPANRAALDAGDQAPVRMREVTVATMRALGAPATRVDERRGRRATFPRTRQVALFEQHHALPPEQMVR